MRGLEQVSWLRSPDDHTVIRPHQFALMERQRTEFNTSTSALLPSSRSILTLTPGSTSSIFELVSSLVEDGGGGGWAGWDALGRRTAGRDMLKGGVWWELRPILCCI